MFKQEPINLQHACAFIQSMIGWTEHENGTCPVSPHVNTALAQVLGYGNVPRESDVRELSRHRSMVEDAKTRLRRCAYFLHDVAAVVLESVGKEEP